MNPEVYELNNTILTIITMISCMSIIIIAAYVYVNSQRTHLFFWFEAWMLLLLLWNFTYMLKLYAPTDEIRYTLLIMEILAVALLGPTILCFARAYRGWDNRWSLQVFVAYSFALIIGLYTVLQPFMYGGYAMLNEEINGYGEIYTVVGIHVFLCFIGGVYYFVRGVKNPSIYWKNQMANVGGAVILIVLAAVVQSLGIIEIELNLPLVLMPISLILVGISIFKYQFLDILPFALSEALNFIDDGFMVFAVEGDLEDYNQEFFQRIIPINKCHTMDDLLLELSRVVSNKMSLNNLKYSISVKKNEFISGQVIIDGIEKPMHLQYTTKGIYDRGELKIASIITFHDMTELQALFVTLEEKKEELIKARIRLEKHIATIKQLTVEKERHHLMLEVHDTLGHSMAEVLALLEQCEIILGEENPDVLKGSKVITEVLQQSRDSLTEIRETVGKFRKMGVEL